MIVLNPSAPAPLLLLMGVVVCVGVHQVFLWIGRRREALHPWVVAWCACTLLVLLGHYAQTIADAPEPAGLGGRLAWSGALLLIPVMIGLSHALAARPMPRPRLAGIVAADLALLAFVWLGTGLVERQVSRRADRLGHHYWALDPGPLMLALVPGLVAVFAYCVSVVGRSDSLTARERRVVLAGFGLYLALAVNDVLHASRVIQSVRLFDYAFVAVAVGLHYLLVTRSNRLAADLEGAVRDQTRALLDAFVDQAAVAVRNASLFEAEGSARRAVEQALAEVKVLRGLLPICSYCKKVRGDENYWEQIESYVSDHSDAQFSHGICPECAAGARKELERWRANNT